jgi:hypothetical protein
MILEFCPDLSQRVYPDRNLPTTQITSPEDEEESSKQRDDEHHASNHGSIILDDARTLAAIFIRNTAAPFPRRDDTRWSTR